MKEAFIRKRFNSKSRGLLKRIVAITEQYQDDGYNLSVRQLFYLLTGTGVIEKTEKSYKNLINLVSDARYAGLIDWDVIRDRNRSVCHPGHCEDVREVVESAKWGLKIDMWKRQAHYVEVFCEKQSLEGVLEPLCYKLDVPFSSNKGYSSSSAFYDAGKRYLAAAEAGKELHVLYLGDHDPSGIDMTRDIDDRFHMFIATALRGRVMDEQELLTHTRPHKLHRLALNMDQVRKLKLQSAPAKVTDRRFEGYAARFGTSCWELAAIEPRQLAKLVEDAVNGLIDRDVWDEDKAREEKHRDEIQAFVDNYGKPPEKEIQYLEYPTRQYDPEEF
jgi:hypothetical protein